MKKITIPDETYWKLMEIKVKLKCRTWKETINELYKLAFESNSFPKKRLKPKGLITLAIAATPS